MSEETREETMARKVAGGIPRVCKTSDIIEVVGYLFDLCAKDLDNDEVEARANEHLTSYLISAICCLFDKIQRVRHLDNEEVHKIVMAAYGLGRLREGHLDTLKSLKEKCVARCGLITKEEAEQAFATSDKEAEGLIKELTDLAKSLGLDIKVVNIPCDNPLANPPKDPTTN